MTHAATDHDTVRVTPGAIPEAPYDVRIGHGILASLGESVARVLPRKRRNQPAFLVVDDKLPDQIVSTATLSLEAAGFAVTSADVAASETNKTLASATLLLRQLASTRAERTDPVIALGGGMIGDLAGFVAATYKRGVPIIQCPTTLLSMVDASVGGKTAVNIKTDTGLKKNIVGAFWQPTLVLADVAALASLPARTLRAGLAECLKHGLLCATFDIETDLFDWTTTHVRKILAKDAATLRELVTRNVRTKAAVVHTDPHELDPNGGRAILNLGHTYAHAIEPIAQLSPTADPADAPLQHGEAVALGVVAAAHASAALGAFHVEHAELIRAAFAEAGLPTRVRALPSDDALLEAMSHDKKASGGVLRLIALDAPKSGDALGRCRVVNDPPRAAIVAGWDALRG
ncbi:MAG: 3-dehydroquinate synthase [Phycisphaerales bacterium]|nr:3-dehydroquinate synthase [Phycisphaerales bacterium]